MLFYLNPTGFIGGVNALALPKSLVQSIVFKANKRHTNTIDIAPF